MDMRGAGLGAFFRPRNIALVGASDKSAWSRMIFSRFATYGHEGELFAVNRSAAPAHGLQGFASLADIPAKIDMAYIYVPAAAAAEAVRLTGAAGVRHAVVLSSGFAEAGEEGGRLQAELLTAAEEAGVLMLGPNSLGFANIADRCVCTSIPTRLPVIPGRLAILSQSGALAAEFGKFAHAQGIGLSFMGATGNEAQLGIADILEYLVEDPATGAIALYVEAIQDPERFVAAATRALAHLQRWSERVLAGDPPPAPNHIATARPQGEREVLAHLAAHGAPVIPASLARDADEAAAAAEELDGPVVLKIASPDIAHKTEAGGVRLGLTGARQVRAAFDEIVSSARAHSPSARVEGVIVSPMRASGVELIVGVARDPRWGLAIVVGLGGVLTEVLQDTQVRLLPVGVPEVEEMLQALKGMKLLQGFRGAPAADFRKLAEVIVSIGEAALALGPELAALEVNPLWVRGSAIECLDGLAAYSG